MSQAMIGDDTKTSRVDIDKNLIDKNLPIDQQCHCLQDAIHELDENPSFEQYQEFFSILEESEKYCTTEYWRQCCSYIKKLLKCYPNTSWISFAGEHVIRSISKALDPKAPINTGTWRQVSDSVIWWNKDQKIQLINKLFNDMLQELEATNSIIVFSNMQNTFVSGKNVYRDPTQKSVEHTQQTRIDTVWNE